LGKLGPAGKAKPRLQTPRTNSPTVSPAPQEPAARHRRAVPGRSGRGAHL